jgi:hypothetical protein
MPKHGAPVVATLRARLLSLHGGAVNLPGSAARSPTVIPPSGPLLEALGPTPAAVVEDRTGPGSLGRRGARQARRQHLWHLLPARSS